MIQVQGSLLQRKIIYPEVQEKVLKLIEMYGDDLDLVRGNFQEGMCEIEKDGLNGLTVDKGFPIVAGALVWVKKMRARISKPMEDIPFLEIP